MNKERISMAEGEKWDLEMHYKVNVEKFGNCIGKHRYALKDVYAKFPETGKFDKFMNSLVHGQFYVPPGSTGKKVYVCKNCGLEHKVEDIEW